MSDNAITVAVLGSSFRRAISQKISQAFNSAILLLLIEIKTFQIFNIYHSQFEFSHSAIIISSFAYFLSSQFKIMCSITL
jgi:hypothetical protein